MNAAANTDTTSSESLEESQDDEGLYDYYCIIIRYIEDITCPLVDTNFIFSCSTRYLMSERSNVFDDFLKISDYFPKIF